MSLDHLEADLVQDSIDQLARRIGARFPERSLHRVALRVRRLADEVEEASDSSRLRLRWMRWVTGALALALAVATALVAVAVIGHLRSTGVGEPPDWLALLESGVNDLVFSAVAIWFLMMVPARLERARMLALLHRLRSVAHVIDMHQVTKDPEHLRADYVPTVESVTDPMGREEMSHYLGYCTELLSMVGKVAALCAEASGDDVVLDTVSDVESLTSDLSATILRKVALLP
ncbi:hypothetical protein [Kytococcus sedentarius]|uniref:hypothetical protein n=1 Tax=Kytococcus sedentarius TaxID=1276 RepID=UPI0035BBF7EB